MMDSGGRDALCKSAALGLVFVTLGSCRVLLIKFSANDEGKYEYLPVTVNLCAEAIKLLVCATLALQYLFASGYKWRDMSCPSRYEVATSVKWAVPGFLYFIDNLLAFYVVKYLQPALVVLLGNFGIITTSVLFRVILKRKFSRVQWSSLLILFLAIICLSHLSHGGMNIDHHRHHAVNHILPVTQSPSPGAESALDSDPSSFLPSICHPENTQFHAGNFSWPMAANLIREWPDSGSASAPWDMLRLHRGHALVLLQCVIASLANVYNKKIFKDGGGLDESIYIQNCRLYAFGVVFNLLSLFVHGVYRQKLFLCGFFHGYNAFSLILIFTTAMYGLNVAFILKFRDNMFHLLSSQVVTVVVTLASIYFFQFKPHLEFFLIAPIVLAAIYSFHMSRQREELQQPSIDERRRVRFMQEVDEGDGFIISRNDLQE